MISVPHRVLEDKLNLTELRLLLFICAAGKRGVSRNVLQNRAGYHKSMMSRALKGLQDKGWIKVDGLTITQPSVDDHATKVDDHATKVAKSATRTASRFEEFWKVYPKKIGKKPAKEKWKARDLDRLAEVIVADVKRRVKMDRQWLEGYVPNPTTYINQDRWEDEMQTRPKGNGGRPQTHAQWERWAKDHDINARPGESWEAFLRRAQNSYEVGR